MAYQSPLITVMAKAASKAAVALIRDYNEADNLVSSKAGAAQFVEASRRRSGETIRRELAHARPDFSFDSPAKGSRWIVSALDGVNNLVHAIPHTSVAVAVEMTGEIVAGVVLDPLRDELFWAERGHGAFMRSRRLRVSGIRSLSGSVLAHGDGVPSALGIARLLKQGPRLRCLGAPSLDLAWLAAGRLDGYWADGADPDSLAAGTILIQEAGGIVTRLDGSPPGAAPPSVLAGNPGIHGHMLRSLA